jgi:hypothetical protein
MNAKSRLGNMEHEAHHKYPRYHTRSTVMPCCSGPHIGKAEREAVGGLLRVLYGDAFRWEYELNGRAVTREVALAALAGARGQ